jgi:protein TonB
MFDVLMGSSGRRERKPGRALVSAALHIVVVASVARATASSLPAPFSEPRIVDLTLDVPAAPAPVRAPVAAPSGIAAAPVLPAPVVAPVDVPAGIPPLTLPGRWDRRTIVPGYVPTGAPGAPVGIGAFNPDSILAESAVDEPATVLLQRPPRYPPSLQSAGLEGRVTVRFVIDAGGRVEPGSIRITSAGHPGFEGSARETIRNTLFSPARVRGRAVRQWAQQAVVFRISP